MSIIAIAVNLGNPDSAGLFPVATTSVANGIGQAQTDLTALGALITTTQSDASTADTDVATVQADITTTTTDITTLLADADNDIGTGAASFAAVLGLTYNSSTHQITGTAGTSATLTASQQNAMALLLNQVLLNILTVQTDNTQSASAATTAKAATAAAKTAANAMSTTAVAADLTAAIAGIAGANVYIQTDSSVVTNISELSSAFVSALTFARDDAILPT